MAGKNSNLVLLAAGAVVIGILLLSKKGSASSALSDGEDKGGKKPTVKIDADDEGPPARVDVEEDSPARVAPGERPDGPGIIDVEVPVNRVPSPPGDGMPLPQEMFATRDPSGTGRWSVSNEDGSPVQADASLARQKAQSIADHVRTKKNGYDRPRLAVWQALAGLTGVDGLYGPATQSALQRMGAKNVPKPLFKGGN